MFTKRSNQKSITVERNEFITKLVLPLDYWFINMSVRNIRKTNLDEKSNLEFNKNNIFELKLDYKKSDKEEEIPHFMRPRKDWHISQGDFIVEEKKEIKRKLFTKQDLKNLKSGFWYLLISSLITYFILHSVSRLV